MRKRRGIALVVTLFLMVSMFMLSAAYFRLVPTELRAALHEQRRSQGYYLANAVGQTVWAWLRFAEDSTGNPTTGLTGAVTGDAVWPRVYRLDLTPNLAQLPGFQPSLLDSEGRPDSSWHCETYLYPDALTDAGQTPRTFKLRTVARYEGNVIYSSEQVLQQQTFAKYGFFVDRLPNGGFYTAFRDDRYQGEFHINGAMPLLVGDSLFSNYAASVFGGDLTFSNATSNAGSDGIAYQSSTLPFDATGSTLIDADGKDRYSKLLSQGRAGIKQTGDVSMPRTNPGSELPYAKAAWFGRNSSADTLSSVSIPSGVNLNESGGTLTGVYVKGNVRDLQLKVVDALGNSVARNSSQVIDHGNPVVSVREESNAAANQNLFTQVVELRDSSIAYSIPAGARVVGQSTPLSAPMGVSLNHTVVVRPPGTSQNPYAETLYEVHNGYPNGVVYVDGNVGKVRKLDQEQAGTLTNDRDWMTGSPNSPGAADESLGGLSGVNYLSAKTICVNVARNNYVRLAGDLTRGDTAPGQPASGRRDGLGLVGYDVLLGGENLYSSATPFYLYSLVMAGRRDVSGATQSGSVVYENWATTPASRVLYSFGSYVVGNDRYWGFAGSGGYSQGWQPTFLHDAALANQPTPFYPTRSDYKLTAYKEAL